MIQCDVEDLDIIHPAMYCLELSVKKYIYIKKEHNFDHHTVYNSDYHSVSLDLEKRFGKDKPALQVKLENKTYQYKFLANEVNLRPSWILDSLLHIPHSR